MFEKIFQIRDSKRTGDVFEEDSSKKIHSDTEGM